MAARSHAAVRSMRRSAFLRASGLVTAASIVGACFGPGTDSGGKTEDAGTQDSGTFVTPDSGSPLDAAVHDSAAEATVDSSVGSDASDASVAEGGGQDATPETSTIPDATAEAGGCNPLTAPDTTTGVFVSGLIGSDASGDGSMANPYKIVGKGIAAAGGASMANVYVAPGTYAESLTFPVASTGVVIEGGWTLPAAGAWGTDCAGSPEQRTTIQGGAIAVQAIGTTVANGVSRMTLQTEAQGITAAGAGGASVIGVLVSGNNARFVLDDVNVVAGKAGSGT